MIGKTMFGWSDWRKPEPMLREWRGPYPDNDMDLTTRLIGGFFHITGLGDRLWPSHCAVCGKRLPTLEVVCKGRCEMELHALYDLSVALDKYIKHSMKPGEFFRVNGEELLIQEVICLQMDYARKFIKPPEEQ